MFPLRMKKRTIATFRYRVGHVSNEKKTWRMWKEMTDYKEDLEFDSSYTRGKQVLYLVVENRKLWHIK